MRVAIVQLNSKVGAIAENLERFSKFLELHSKQAELFVMPELALIGYPPRDLLALPHYLDSEKRALEQLEEFSKKFKIGILVSHCESHPSARKGLYNCATLYDSGQCVGKVRKSRLPYYDIFEEERFFSTFDQPQENLQFRGKSLGVFICEDAWDEIHAFGKNDVHRHSTESSALDRLKKSDLIINLSASPFYMGKSTAREKLFQSIAKECARPLIYVNSVGANDEILFDGRSFAFSADGRKVSASPAFRENCAIVDPFSSTSDLELSNDAWPEMAHALTLGIQDYARKSGFKKVLLGISGGIDSALVAWLAVQAVGAENVSSISMPTQFNSIETRTDAKVVAERLKIAFQEIPIQSAVELFSQILSMPNTGLPFENLQSRIRGLILMAISNQQNALLLACGNKSELAMGYSTLYGDMCGGLLPIGDLFKTDVYGLCRWINQNEAIPPFPESLLNRAPSAELAPGQKDSDSLPDYSVLDAYLADFIENQATKAVAWKNFPDPKTNGVDLYKRFARQEFKRKQAAPILKIRARSFGLGWKMPLAKSDGVEDIF